MENKVLKEKQNGLNFPELYQRFDKLDNGLQAALRRVAEPEELRDTVALYRLFTEAKPNDYLLRVTFLLPWCKHSANGNSLGAILAEHKINERRILQMAATKEPLDIIQLRRMVMQVKPKPVVDWGKLGWTLYKWSREDKRQIVEDYFYNKFNGKDKTDAE